MELLAKVVVLGLAVYRVSHAITLENGPFGLFEKLRERTGVYHADDVVGVAAQFLAQTLGCMECMITIVGAGASVVSSPNLTWFLITWFATSGVALLLDSMTASVMTVGGMDG